MQISNEVKVTLIGVAIGALIGFVLNLAYDNIKERRERIKVAKIIYNDVQNAETTLYTFLDELPQEEAMSKDYINANEFDTRIFEAYLDKIPLLSTIDAARVLSFYGELTKANEAMGILKNKHLSAESRKH